MGERYEFVVRLLLVFLLALSACGAERQPRTLERIALVSVAEFRYYGEDVKLRRCRRAILKARAITSAAGASAFERRRAVLLGRAQGAPLLWIRSPADSAEPFRGEAGELLRLVRNSRQDRAHLRHRVLREGYLYSEEPRRAAALVRHLGLQDLFDQDRVFLQRGDTTFELTREMKNRQAHYVHDNGEPAALLLGDRVATDPSAFGQPLHRDPRDLAQRLGFDHMSMVHLTEQESVARLYYGKWEIEALLRRKGARLQLSCLNLSSWQRKRLERLHQKQALRKEALVKLSRVITEQSRERLPFDRPHLEEGAERDGQLRPEWRWAFKQGRAFFSFEDRSYPVFAKGGAPRPPQVCVDFVLETFERASGTWYTSRGRPPQRARGGVDFHRFGIKNRRGVLALEKFAMLRPTLFKHWRLKPEERIKFRSRERFFDFLLSHAKDFQAGDIVAIQGLKRDGKVHQHALLIEQNDPLTGFPLGLADQMKWPRRRSWESIMAEAPLRSLLYRLRPTEALLRAVVTESSAGLLVSGPPAHPVAVSASDPLR